MTHLLMYILVGAIAVAVAGMAIQLLWVVRTYAPVRRRSKGRDEALERLLADIEAGRDHIMVACEEEDCVLATEGAVPLTRALVAAKKANPEILIEFIWGGRRERLPQFLETLARAGTISVEYSRGRLPFIGRIVDGKVVEVYGRPRDHDSPQDYMRVKRAAPGVATRLLDVARAA